MDGTRTARQVSGSAAALAGTVLASLALLAPVALAGEAAAQRVISLNPSLTAILLALDARDTIVGVDDFSARQQPSVADLPRVGGLFNPSLEAVVALRPDLVIVVPSVEQRDFRQRLEGMGIAVSSFENIRFDQVLENISRLGRLVGREQAAARRVQAIRSKRGAVERVSARRPVLQTLVVLQREPIFVVGRGSFIHEMLEASGARNLAARFDEPYPRVAVEWIIAAAPEVLIDVSTDAQPAYEFWSRWPSLPAVANRRVLVLDPDRLILPGPYLDRSLELLVTALHGQEIRAEIEAGSSNSIGGVAP